MAKGLHLHDFPYWNEARKIQFAKVDAIESVYLPIRFVDI